MSRRDPKPHKNWQNWPRAPRWAMRWESYQEEIGEVLTLNSELTCTVG